MNKYKINFIYNEKATENINDILIKTLKKEIQNYIKICKNNLSSNKYL